LGAVYALILLGTDAGLGMMTSSTSLTGICDAGMYIAYLAVVVLHAGPLTFTLLAAVGVVFPRGVVYYLLIRQVMRGPMLAQILSTFGLALGGALHRLLVLLGNLSSRFPGSALGGNVRLGSIPDRHPAARGGDHRDGRSPSACTSY